MLLWTVDTKLKKEECYCKAGCGVRQQKKKSSISDWQDSQNPIVIPFLQSLDSNQTSTSHMSVSPLMGIHVKWRMRNAG